jgi:hypothetical protein
MVPMPGIDQQLNPAFSPDGTKIVFHGVQGGHADIFLFDLQAKTITNLTQDDAFDFAPTYSPDGKWIYYSGVQGTTAKIFRFQPGVSGSREQITYGDWNDEDASVSPDGKRLYFTSDRDGGIYNIYSINLTTAARPFHQTSSRLPAPGPRGPRLRRLKFFSAAYYKRRFTLRHRRQEAPMETPTSIRPRRWARRSPYPPPIQWRSIPEDHQKPNTSSSRRTRRSWPHLDRPRLQHDPGLGTSLGDRRWSVSSDGLLVHEHPAEVPTSRSVCRRASRLTTRGSTTSRSTTAPGVVGHAALPLHRRRRLRTIPSTAITGSRGLRDSFAAVAVRSTSPDTRQHHRHSDTEHRLGSARASWGHHAVRDPGRSPGKLFEVNWSPYITGLKLPDSSGTDSDAGYRRGPAALFRDPRRSLVALRLYGFRDRLPRRARSAASTRPGASLLRHFGSSHAFFNAELASRRSTSPQRDPGLRESAKGVLDARAEEPAVPVLSDFSALRHRHPGRRRAAPCSSVGGYSTTGASPR